MTETPDGRNARGIRDIRALASPELNAEARKGPRGIMADLVLGVANISTGTAGMCVVQRLGTDWEHLEKSKGHRGEFALLGKK